jgi:hypothetical protein
MNMLAPYLTFILRLCICSPMMVILCWYLDDGHYSTQTCNHVRINIINKLLCSTDRIRYVLIMSIRITLIGNRRRSHKTVQ